MTFILVNYKLNSVFCFIFVPFNSLLLFALCLTVTTLWKPVNVFSPSGCQNEMSSAPCRSLVEVRVRLVAPVFTKQFLILQSRFMQR